MRVRRSLRERESQTSGAKTAGEALAGLTRRQALGTGQMISVVGTSLGPLPLGIAFDLLGSYTTTLRLLALLPLACATAALFLRTPAGIPVDARLE
jgi:hypothetical protein